MIYKMKRWNAIQTFDICCNWSKTLSLMERWSSMLLHYLCHHWLTAVTGLHCDDSAEAGEPHLNLATKSRITWQGRAKWGLLTAPARGLGPASWWGDNKWWWLVKYIITCLKCMSQSQPQVPTRPPAPQPSNNISNYTELAGVKCSGFFSLTSIALYSQCAITQ